jgi:hypothetical protein
MNLAAAQQLTASPVPAILAAIATDTLESPA